MGLVQKTFTRTRFVENLIRSFLQLKRIYCLRNFKTAKTKKVALAKLQQVKMRSLTVTKKTMNKKEH